jgi:hypothetical protein
LIADNVSKVVISAMARFPNGHRGYHNTVAMAFGKSVLVPGKISPITAVSVSAGWCHANSWNWGWSTAFRLRIQAEA